MTYDSIPKERLSDLTPEDRKNLKRLSEKLEKTKLDPQIIGDVLPEAVILGETSQNKVSKSMIEVTEKAITYSIIKNPEKLSTALFPIIGTAIKKAIQKMMNEMMRSLNSSMENVFSYKRMLWRLESVKTGIPFIEIVMKNTMSYRVEHVFLIHRDSSLLLHHISLDDSFPTDSDIVASMLTAVQDYIKDSLALDSKDTVHSISTGDYTILIEDGPKAIIAAVVKGVVDTSLQNRMLESLEAIHLKLSSELDSFAGDTEVFQRAEALLRPCLTGIDNAQEKKPVYAIFLLSLLALIFAGAVTFSFYSARLNKEFINALNREPGILVASEIKRLGHYEIRLLRDSRSKTIDSIAQSSGIELGQYDIIIEEFISPIFGEIDMTYGTGIAGELLELSRELQGHILLFEQDSETLREDQQQELTQIIQLIEEILTFSDEKELKVQIELIGHSAGSVQDVDSIKVSQDRAALVYSVFEEKNPTLAKRIRPMGVGIGSPVVQVEETEEDRRKNRSVTFKVIFE